MMRTSFDRLTGTADEIEATITGLFPGVNLALARARAMVNKSKREISGYQAAVLYAYASLYDNRPDAEILEIGTAYGYSAAVMALAARRTRITTINPKEAEYPQAVKNLSSLTNVTPIKDFSWDYYRRAGDYDLIFVDGDHGQVDRDLVYWEKIRSGGLMLFHDYSPNQSWRPCQPVYDIVNGFALTLGLKEPDVLIVDDGGVGMAGFYKPADRPEGI